MSQLPSGDVIAAWVSGATTPNPAVAREIMILIGPAPATDAAVDAATEEVGGLRGWTPTTTRQHGYAAKALVRTWMHSHTPEGIRLVDHEIMVRPGVPVVVSLPADLTARESARVGQWIALLGVDEPRPVRPMRPLPSHGETA